MKWLVLKLRWLLSIPLFLNPLFFSSGLMLASFGLHSYSEFEDAFCIRKPTMVCVEDSLARFGAVQSGFLETKKGEHVPFLDAEFDRIKEDPAKPFDPDVIEKTYETLEKRAAVSKLLAWKFVEDSKFGSMRSYNDPNRPMLGKFQTRRMFEHFKPSATFYSVIDYSMETARKLDVDSKNNHLFSLLPLLIGVKDEERITSVLSEIRDVQRLDSYVLMKRLIELRDMNIEFSLDPRVVSRKYRARVLILQNRKNEAVRLLFDERREIADILENDPSANMIRLRRRLESIARLFFSAGEKEEAVKTVDMQYKSHKDDYIGSTFISYRAYSSLYRSVGERQKSRDLMKDYMDPNNSRSCSSFHRPVDHLNCATELVYLGYPEIGYRKAFNACRHIDDCRGIFSIYKAALLTGAELPDFDEMLKTVHPVSRSRLLLDISILHFLDGDPDRGNYFLEKVLNDFSKNDRNIETLCFAARIAFLMDRADLLRRSYKEGIQAAFFSSTQVRVRMYLYRHINRCFGKLGKAAVELLALRADGPAIAYR